MLVTHGFYIGNAAGRSVTGVGFTPDLVLTKNLHAASDTWFRTAAMAANTSFPVRADAGGSTTRILSLDADGFTVSTDTAVAGDTNTIVWMAFKDNGAGDFGVFNYTGDNTDDKLVFGTFQPDFALIKGQTSIVGCTKWAAMPSALADAASNEATTTWASGAVRADLMGFFSDGLRVSNSSAGGSNSINTNAQAHFGFALKASAHCAVGSYTGDAVAGRIITTNIDAGFIIVKKRTAAAHVNAWRSQMESGNSISFDGTQVTGKVSNPTTTGFTVSAHSDVNASGSTYYWLAVAGPARGGMFF